MKNLSDMLLLGDERLYKISEPVEKSELPLVNGWVADLHNVMEEIRVRYQFGRAIAAPQLGIMKRLIYININEPIILINPVLDHKSDEMFELWDDCMSFPNLYVKVSRHRSVTIKYFDAEWQPKEWAVADDLSELVQHEYDHLNGILATMRAVDEKSFKWRAIPS